MNGHEKTAGTEDSLKVLSGGRTIRSYTPGREAWSRGRKNGRGENLGQAWWCSNHTKRKRNGRKKGEP